MEWRSYKTGIDDENRRIDRVVRNFLPGLTLSLLYKELRKGNIRVNGKKIQPDYRVVSGDTVDVSRFIAESRVAAVLQPDGQDSIFLPDILFENEHILAVNKPYDVSVHGGGSSPDANARTSLASSVLAYTSQKQNDSLSFHSGPLHRLDRKTTGVVVFSRSLAGAQWFSEAVREHCIEKIYIGIALGHLETQAIWKDYIKKDTSASFVRVQGAETGEECITEVCPLAYGIGANNAPLTLARYKIITGKTHQIRFQTSSHGYPLWGDSAYNGGHIEHICGQDFYLHALQLGIPVQNPLSLPPHISAPLPEAFKEMLQKYFSCSDGINPSDFTAFSGNTCYNSYMDFSTSGTV